MQQINARCHCYVVAIIFLSTLLHSTNFADSKAPPGDQQLILGFGV